MVSQKAMNAVGVFIARAVMVKRQNGVKISSEKKRGRKPRWARANHDAIVETVHVNALQSV